MKHLDDTACRNRDIIEKKSGHLLKEVSGFSKFYSHSIVEGGFEEIS